MNTNQIILMGDIIDSRLKNSVQLMSQFNTLTIACNNKYESKIISPLTITLGDEFQGIANSVYSGIASILFCEEYRLSRQLEFKIRYVLYEGIIETDINTEYAYGMLGPGLTDARALLPKKGRNQPRFKFRLGDRLLTERLMKAFTVLEYLIDGWSLKDYPFVYQLIKNENNLEVGNLFNMNRGQVWKRRKNLKIPAYTSLKELIFSLAE